MKKIIVIIFAVCVSLSCSSCLLLLAGDTSEKNKKEIEFTKLSFDYTYFGEHYNGEVGYAVVSERQSFDGAKVCGANVELEHPFGTLKIRVQLDIEITSKQLRYIDYKVYDDGGYVVDYGTVWVGSTYSYGDKIKKELCSFKVEANKNYTIYIYKD